MDLTTVEEFVAGAGPADWRPGDAWLAGGTWLFSEPQFHLRRLLDLSGVDWPALEPSAAGLTVAATCTIAELYAFAGPDGPDGPARPDRPGGVDGTDEVAGPVKPLIRQCCEAFLASFKIWNLATVGGNLCNALPAGPMISLTAALDGECLILTPAGTERRCSVVDFVVGNNQNGLRPGELLRSITLPAAALNSRTAFRQTSLTTLGRSAALLVGRLDDSGFTLTVTAATVRPVQLLFARMPSAVALRSAIDERIPFGVYHDDIHGLPSWRRHLTYHWAEEIRQELAA